MDLKHAMLSFVFGFRVFLLTTLAVCIPTAHAMEEAEVFKAQFLASCGKTIDKAYELLLPAIRQIAPDLLRNDRRLVLLVPTAEFNAFADYQYRRVLIPVMTCIETWYGVDADMQVTLDSSLRKRALQYWEYLSRRKAEAFESGLFDNIPIKPFYIFASTRPLDFETPEGRRQMVAMEQAIVGAVTFLIAHEVGHLALKHRPYKEISKGESRRQESAADEFAVNLLSKANISILPSIFVFQRLISTEQSTSLTALRGTHPAAVCRVARILLTTREIDEMLRDPTSRKRFEDASGLRANRFHQYLRDMESSCDP